MNKRSKLKNIKAAIWNIWHEHYFVFDPGEDDVESLESNMNKPKPSVKSTSLLNKFKLYYERLENE